jgi:hypothetical protein
LGVTGGVATSHQELGPPTTTQGWVDLMAEAALLPKPQLMPIQSGAVSVPQGAQQQNVNAMQGAGQGMANLLSNPLVQEWMRRNPHVIAERAAQAFPALNNEAEKKWERVSWTHDPKVAKQQAMASNKPIFIEMVVGRYGDARNDAQC